MLFVLQKKSEHLSWRKKSQERDVCGEGRSKKILSTWSWFFRHFTTIPNSLFHESKGRVQTDLKRLKIRLPVGLFPVLFPSAE